MMGHSAGATNVFTAMMLPETADTGVFRSSISGVILCAGVHGFAPLPLEHRSWDLAVQYWGGRKEVEEGCPTALLSRASDAAMASFPRSLVVEGEREPQWLVTVGKEFRQAFKGRTGKKLNMIVARGHNHISLDLALGTGEGEEWAEDVLRWIASARGRSKV